MEEEFENKIFEENKHIKKAGPTWIEWDEEREQWKIANNITDAEKHGLELIDQHTKWFSSLVTKVYREALKHGFKHGYEKGYKDGKEESNNEG